MKWGNWNKLKEVQRKRGIEKEKYITINSDGNVCIYAVSVCLYADEVLFFITCNYSSVEKEEEEEEAFRTIKEHTPKCVT